MAGAASLAAAQKEGRPEAAFDVVAAEEGRA